MKNEVLEIKQLEGESTITIVFSDFNEIVVKEFLEMEIDNNMPEKYCPDCGDIILYQKDSRNKLCISCKRVMTTWFESSK